MELLCQRRSLVKDRLILIRLFMIVLGWLGLVLLIIFHWFPYSYYWMVSWPWIAVWQSGFLCLSLWLIGMLRQQQIPFRLLGYGIDLVVGLGAIALILSTVFSEFFQVSVWYTFLAFCYVLLLYIFRNWLEYKAFTLDRLWGGLSSVGIITGSIALGRTIYNLSIGETIWRNPYPLGHHNFVAGYLILILPITISFGLTRKGWLKIPILLASGMLAFDLYTTQSRGCFLGILVVTIVILGFLIVRSNQKLKSIAIAIVSLIIVTMIILNSQRVREIFRVSLWSDRTPKVEVKIDGPTEDRLYMGQALFNLFQDRPLLGVGPGNISRTYNLYRPVEVGTGASHVQQLHNTLFNIIGELGAVGLSVYLLLLGILCRLWLRLDRQLHDRNHCLLLYGIGASLLGYGVSSLTDYQLENIGISSTIVILIVLLIKLADANSCSSLTEECCVSLAKNRSKIPSFDRRDRLWLSFGVAAFLVAELSTWIPVSSAMYLGSVASIDLSKGKILDSYNKLTTAAMLVPWDPSYNQFAGLELLRAKSAVEEQAFAQDLEKSTIDRLQQALKASPNDAWFNHNLAILYENIDAKKAEIYFSRAIQLQPRDVTYLDYFSLANAYLQQGKKAKAIHALALQTLIIPEFLTFKIWSNPTFSSLYDDVFKETIDLFKELLIQVSSQDPVYDRISETIALLNWWHQSSEPISNNNNYRPLIKALLLVEKSPNSALDILDRSLESDQNNLAFLLLRAWIEPEKYLPAYIQQNKTTDRESIAKSIQLSRNFRNWLKSMDAQLTSSDRVMDVLVYRNIYVAEGDSILVTKNIQPNFLISQLQLFPAWDRSFPLLEKLIDRIKTDELELIHPTQNKFKLIPSLPTNK